MSGITTSFVLEGVIQKVILKYYWYNLSDTVSIVMTRVTYLKGLYIPMHLYIHNTPHKASFARSYGNIAKSSYLVSCFCTTCHSTLKVQDYGPREDPMGVFQRLVTADSIFVPSISEYIFITDEMETFGKNANVDTIKNHNHQLTVLVSCLMCISGLSPCWKAVLIGGRLVTLVLLIGKCYSSESSHSCLFLLLRCCFFAYCE